MRERQEDFKFKTSLGRRKKKKKKKKHSLGYIMRSSQKHKKNIY
jgi:hypothetical protein